MCAWYPSYWSSPCSRAATRAGDSEPAPQPTPSRAISEAELGEHLSALQEIANGSGGTRAAGTPGDRASVDYVAKRLREAGWTVRLQQVRFPYFELRDASMSIGAESCRRRATSRC